MIDARRRQVAVLAACLGAAAAGAGCAGAAQATSSEGLVAGRFTGAVLVGRVVVAESFLPKGPSILRSAIPQLARTLRAQRARRAGSPTVHGRVFMFPIRGSCLSGAPLKLLPMRGTLEVDLGSSRGRWVVVSTSLDTKYRGGSPDTDGCKAQKTT